jgi:hypothetical protein
MEILVKGVSMVQARQGQSREEISGLNGIRLPG